MGCLEEFDLGPVGYGLRLHAGVWLDFVAVEDLWVADHCRFVGLRKRLNDLHFRDLILKRDDFV